MLESDLGDLHQNKVPGKQRTSKALNNSIGTLLVCKSPEDCPEEECRHLCLDKGYDYFAQGDTDLLVRF
jgi:hypothetical protein